MQIDEVRVEHRLTGGVRRPGVGLDRGLGAVGRLLDLDDRHAQRGVVGTGQRAA